MKTPSGTKEDPFTPEPADREPRPVPLLVLLLAIGVLAGVTIWLIAFERVGEGATAAEAPKPTPTDCYPVEVCPATATPGQSCDKNLSCDPDPSSAASVSKADPAPPLAPRTTPPRTATTTTPTTTTPNATTGLPTVPVPSLKPGVRA